MALPRSENFFSHIAPDRSVSGLLVSTFAGVSVFGLVNFEGLMRQYRKPLSFEMYHKVHIKSNKPFPFGDQLSVNQDVIVHIGT